MGVYKLKIGPSNKLSIGPSFHCFPHFIVFWGHALKTQIVQQCVKRMFLQNCLDVKNEVFENKLHFFVLFVGEIETEKRKKNKMEQAKKTYKNSFFKVVIQQCEKKVKNMDF